jgi:hypothetical protein
LVATDVLALRAALTNNKAALIAGPFQPPEAQQQQGKKGKKKKSKQAATAAAGIQGVQLLDPSGAVIVNKSA